MTDSTDRPPNRTRERIVASADRLFYEGGYQGTSFATVAAEVGISRGNFHHHFKAKDDILTEVIDRRRNTTRAMLARWEAASASPAVRIGRFIDMVVTNQVDIMRHGCPVGSLCAELAKTDHPHLDDAGTVFELFRAWLRHPEPQTVSTSVESVALSKELKRRGWRLVGPTTVFAFVQAMGLVNDHAVGCAYRSAAEEQRASLVRPVN